MSLSVDELQTLLRSTIDLADQLSDDTSEWMWVEHRLQTLKENLNYLLTKSNREHRELKVKQSALNEILFTHLYLTMVLDKSRSNRRSTKWNGRNQRTN